MHTVASDGTMFASEIVEEVKSKSVKLFAVTDHDSVDIIDEMMTLTRETDLLFVPGVEISVNCRGTELHILTYGIDTGNEVLKDILKENIAIRDRHNQAIIQYACEQYPQVTLELYDQYQEDVTRGGWKAVNFLMDHQVISDLPSFFRFIQEFGEPLTFIAYDEVIPKLSKLGYTLVLAHPPAYQQGSLLSETFLDELVSLGICGIECYSPYYKQSEDSQYYQNYCVQRGLWITSGSDYHGAFIPTRKMAQPQIDMSMVSEAHFTQLALNAKK